MGEVVGLGQVAVVVGARKVAAAALQDVEVGRSGQRIMQVFTVAGVRRSAAAIRHSAEYGGLVV